MKNNERNARTFFLAARLDGTLLESSVVKGALASLEQRASALKAAEADELARKDAVRASAERVRDATAKAFDECRRGHGALVAADPSLDEKLSKEQTGRSPRALLARAYSL